MPIPITMPALSPTMTEGTLAKWFKAEGDPVAAGDVIAEIETDKATMELESIEDGTLGKIVVPEGTEGVAVNAVIGLILAEGEDQAALEGADVSSAPAAPTPTPAELTSAPTEAAPAAPAAVVAAVAPATAPTSAAAAPVVEMAAPQAGTGSGRTIASPLARRMAAQAGLDLTAIRGSGPKGRIVKADIDQALSGGGAAQTAAVTQLAPAPTPQIEPGAAYTEIPTTKMRRIIARRLTEAKSTIPHFYLSVDCEIDRVADLRKDLNARGAEGGDYKLSLNDFIIRAAALALRQVPTANASWTEKAILQYNTADVSVAVAIPDGLITPVIRGADGTGLATISAEMKDLAGRAREGKLMPEEYQGGTFSISNLGMFGIKEFAAVINPPQGAILAVGAGEARSVVKDGALAIATMMTCTLSIDHRVVDGTAGAQFMAAFKALIEDPLTMLL